MFEHARLGGGERVGTCGDLFIYLFISQIYRWGEVRGVGRRGEGGERERGRERERDGERENAHPFPSLAAPSAHSPLPSSRLKCPSGRGWIRRAVPLAARPVARQWRRRRRRWGRRIHRKRVREEKKKRRKRRKEEKEGGKERSMSETHPFASAASSSLIAFDTSMERKRVRKLRIPKPPHPGRIGLQTSLPSCHRFVRWFVRDRSFKIRWK